MAEQGSVDLNLVASTVNGSGSQSANLVLTRAVFAMGIPVAPKNLFPSNIEGLPTWFYLRANSMGYRAGRRRADLLVSLDRATFQADIARLEPGGVLVYEEAFGPPQLEEGVPPHLYPVPFGKLAKDSVPDPDLRKYLTNIIYVGVVAEILGIPDTALEAALTQQFRTKPKALAANRDALALGRDYFQTNLTKTDSLQLRPMDRISEQLLLDGNQTAALGAIMGGCTVLAWYPITPSSSLAEHVISLADRYRIDPETQERRIATIQAEDELAAAGMVLGAGWAGARAMTTTSGPGISLMAELVGLGYYAEIPGVFVDVQRVGPSTGLPTRTMQGDVSFAYTLSHGDTRHPVLLPGTVLECYLFLQQAFDLAEQLQTPIFVLSDLDLGMNLWMTEPLPYPERGFDRGKVLDKEALNQMARFERYRDVDGDGIPWRTVPGTEHPLAAYFTRGSGHDEAAHYTESDEAYTRVMDRLARKLENGRERLPAPVLDGESAEVGIIAYGSSHHAVVEARDILAATGIPTDYLRVRALPAAATVADFVADHARVYVVDQNRDGQMHQILQVELGAHLAERLRSLCHYDGLPLFAADLVEALRIQEIPTPTSGPAAALAGVAG
ncbi:MAG TPA: 2-oxoacid:acceptor oxidoreductase subunit alpha [Candidatus Acidoferrales bacterium]|nr:2-oxoacid:acceptor oxidoreductase subunit alpha [Candidatus Acidoferrales bacterium]